MDESHGAEGHMVACAYESGLLTLGVRQGLSPQCSAQLELMRAGEGQTTSRVMFEGAVTNVRFFRSGAKPATLFACFTMCLASAKGPDVHLLATCAMEGAVIYRLHSCHIALCLVTRVQGGAAPWPCAAGAAPRVGIT